MPESVTPVLPVVEEVAAAEEVAPTDLPPLADVVSSETMTRLRTEWTNQTESTEFTYLWYHITVCPNGEIIVSLPES